MDRENILQFYRSGNPFSNKGLMVIYDDNMKLLPTRYIFQSSRNL